MDISPFLFSAKTQWVHRSFKHWLSPWEEKQRGTIQKANKVHGNTYDYSLTQYINCSTKLDIICKKHGPFKQYSYDHLKGSGCRKCGNERSGEKLIGLYREKCFDINKKLSETNGKFYLLRFSNQKEKFLKIGITSRDLKYRFSGLKYDFEKIFVFDLKMPEAFKLEQHIKHIFKKLKYLPEIKFGGRTECFQESKKIISFVKQFENQKSININ